MDQKYKEHSPKLTYCTVCMNRLNHLSTTLPINLEENSHFDNVTFVVLDYNSQDGLQQWVEENLGDYLRTGRLVYYKNKEVDQFYRSHSRNMAFKLADTEIVCNVDSDNIVLAGYTEYVLKQFSQKADIFVTVDTNGAHYSFRDVVGRICCNKKDFLSIAGYDETMSGYGFEDNDLMTRLERLGRQRVVVDDIRLLSAIKHDDGDRVKHESGYRKLYAVFLMNLPNEGIKFILLQNDHTFFYGTVTPTKYKGEVIRFSLKNKREGTWNWTKGNGMTLDYTAHRQITLRNDCPGSVFYTLTDGASRMAFTRVLEPSKIEEALLIFMLVDNQEIYQRNNALSKIAVNDEGFGKGIVYRNFDWSQPICLQ